MRMRVFIIVVFSSLALLLAGCNQSVDELLKMGEEILKGLTDEDGNEETTLAVENDDEVKESVDDETQEPSQQDEEEEEEEENLQVADFEAFQSGDYTPFHVQLQEDGYSLYSLPNGFPFDLPYHWVLVDGEFGTQNHYFEGEFCYYLPYDNDGLVDVFGDYTGANVTRHGGDEQFFEKTTYAINTEYYNTSGVVEYYVDDNDHTCAHLTVDDSDAEIFYPLFGEDPTTMVGPEDPDYQESNVNDEMIQLENFHFVDDNRQRELPDRYDDMLARLQTLDLNQNDEAMSIRQELNNGTKSMIHMDERFMRILPYEWFVIEINENQSTGTSLTMCTDLTVEQSLAAQLDMLENYNANIYDFQVENETTADLAKLTYEFNDPYYTGSWSGQTWFNYTDNAGEFSGYRCMGVDMHFISDRLD